MTTYTHETMSADSLCNRISRLADNVYIKYDGDWQLITHITNYQVIDGAWISDDFIDIELNESRDIRIHRYDNVDIRYDANEGDALDNEIAEDHTSRDIVHTDDLDKFNRLLIKDVPANAPERYIWKIEFINEAGETYGSCSEGIWFDSIAAAIAAGYTYYIMEEKE